MLEFYSDKYGILTSPGQLNNRYLLIDLEGVSKDFHNYCALRPPHNFVHRAKELESQWTRKNRAEII